MKNHSQYSKFFKTALCAISLQVCFSQSLQAGVWVQSALLYSNQFQSSGSFSSVSTDTHGDQLLTASTLGYAFWQGFLLSFEGLTARESANNDHSFAWGPKAGFLFKGLEFTAGYLPVADHYIQSSHYSGGGFTLNAGYTLKVAGPFRLGMQLTYWQMTFNDLDGRSLVTKQRLRYIWPGLAIGFDF